MHSLDWQLGSCPGCYSEVSIEVRASSASRAQEWILIAFRGPVQPVATTSRKAADPSPTKRHSFSTKGELSHFCLFAHLAIVKRARSLPTLPRKHSLTTPGRANLFGCVTPIRFRFLAPATFDLDFLESDQLARCPRATSRNTAHLPTTRLPSCQHRTWWQQFRGGRPFTKRLFVGRWRLNLRHNSPSKLLRLLLFCA